MGVIEIAPSVNSEKSRLARAAVASTLEGRLRKGAQEGDRWKQWEWCEGMQQNEILGKASSAFPFSNSFTFSCLFQDFTSQSLLFVLGLTHFLPHFPPPSLPFIHSTAHKKWCYLVHMTPPFLPPLLDLLGFREIDTRSGTGLAHRDLHFSLSFHFSVGDLGTVLVWLLSGL